MSATDGLTMLEIGIGLTRFLPLCFVFLSPCSRKRLSCANIVRILPILANISKLICLLCFAHGPARKRGALCQYSGCHSTLSLSTPPLYQCTPSLTKWNGGGNIFLSSSCLFLPDGRVRGARTLFCAWSLRGSSWSLPRLSVMLRSKGGRITWNGRRNREQ